MRFENSAFPSKILEFIHSFVSQDFWVTFIQINVEKSRWMSLFVVDACNSMNRVCLKKVAERLKGSTRRNGFLWLPKEQNNGTLRIRDFLSRNSIAWMTIWFNLLFLLCIFQKIEPFFSLATLVAMYRN